MSGSRDDGSQEARRRWSQRHGGLDAESSGWVSGWLGLVHRVAVPLARRHVSPSTLTAYGVVVSLLVPVAVLPGGAWPLLATVLVVAGAFLDGLDGAVADLDGTASRWGEVLDPLADRVSDVAFVAALFLLGGPDPLCVALVVLTLLHESLRASARAAGMPGVGAVTVWERPSRVIVAAFTTGFCAFAWWGRGLPYVEPGPVAVVGTTVAVVLAVVGLGHLLLAVRRRMRDG